MTEADKCYLSVLADYCNGRKTIPEHPDDPAFWKRICTLAEAHATSGIVWKQCGQFLQEKQMEIAGRIHKGFMQEILKYHCARQDLQEVSEALKEAEIPFLLMKGARVQNYYPEPALRTMADIDILIRKEDRGKSDRIMKNMGFYSYIGNQAVWVYDRDLVSYEFHDRMMYETLTSSVDYSAYFDQVWEHLVPDPETGMQQIEPSYHYLYLLVHLAKHVIHAGMGFRSFMDLSFAAEQEKDRIDWDWLQQELRYLQLDHFAATCASLCKYWFGVSLPFAGLPLTEEFLTEATERVIEDGTFGRRGRRNTEGYAAKDIKRSRLPYWLESIRIMFKRAFPSYQDMRIIPWYSFLDGRPWLLPAAWIYRWFRALTKNPVGGTHTLLEPVEKRKIIEQREKYLDQWGL